MEPFGKSGDANQFLEKGCWNRKSHRRSFKSMQEVNKRIYRYKNKYLASGV